jgi:hypothetical protein
VFVENKCMSRTEVHKGSEKNTRSDLRSFDEVSMTGKQSHVCKAGISFSYVLEMSCDKAGGD